MNYNWLLFDLDNTLLDFTASERYALQTGLEQEGIPYSETIRDIYKEINTYCWGEYEEGRLDKESLRTVRFERFFEAIKAFVDPVVFSQRYRELLAETEFKVPGAMELLDSLKPNYRLGIITNGLKEVQRPRLKKTGLDDYFELIVVSDEIGHAKPQSGFFDYAFDQIGHPNKDGVLVIGDSLNSDIKGGNNYGVDTCWFNPKQRDNITAIQPRYVINDLLNLQEYI